MMKECDWYFNFCWTVVLRGFRVTMTITFTHISSYLGWRCPSPQISTSTFVSWTSKEPECSVCKGQLCNNELKNLTHIYPKLASNIHTLYSYITHLFSPWHSHLDFSLLLKVQSTTWGFFFVCFRLCLALYKVNKKGSNLNNSFSSEDTL